MRRARADARSTNSSAITKSSNGSRILTSPRATRASTTWISWFSALFRILQTVAGSHHVFGFDEQRRAGLAPVVKHAGNRLAVLDF